MSLLDVPRLHGLRTISSKTNPQYTLGSEVHRQTRPDPDECTRGMKGKYSEKERENPNGTN